MFQGLVQSGFPPSKQATVDCNLKDQSKGDNHGYESM